MVEVESLLGWCVATIWLDWFGILSKATHPTIFTVVGNNKCMKKPASAGFNLSRIGLKFA